MKNNLVLSIFPGIDLLGRAFEEEGYCVVRGPDLLWGGDIHTFHPPAGVFEGIIGGPPCKGESALAHLNKIYRPVGETMVSQFFRVAAEVEPDWWVMEAVKYHRSLPTWVGNRRPPNSLYHVLTLNARWLGEKQNRKRYFHSNLRLEQHVDIALWEHPEWKHAVLAGHGGKEGTVLRRMATYSWQEMCELQGLPEGYDLPNFTRKWKREVVGNAVPMPMGRAIAKAVRRATDG